MDAKGGEAATGWTEEAPAGAGASASDRRWTRVAALLLALQLALLLHGAWKVGPTFDEHFYIAAGYAYLQDGEFALNREHPPLLKMLAGFPLLLVPDVRWSPHWQDLVNYPATFFYQRNAEDLDRNLFLARLPFCVLTTVLSWAVFAVSRRFFSARAACAALALFALDPNVLAHGRLAALDMGVSAFLFFAAVAYLHHVERPSSPRLLLAAVLFGLAQLAKYTSLLLVPLFVVLAALAAWNRRSLRPFRDLVLVFLGGLAVFAAGYGFEAKSINAAWGDQQYVLDVRPADLEPAVLADALRREQSGEEQKLLDAEIEAVERAPSLEAATASVLRLFDARGSASIARALGALEDAPGELKKRAFHAVLDAPEEHCPAEVKLSVLARLAGCSHPDLEAWRAFWTEAAGRSWDRTILTQSWIEALVRGVGRDDVPFPLFTALKGVDYQMYHGQFGHGSYFRGRTLQPPRDFLEGNPHPEYYAVLLGIKSPVAYLVALVLALVFAFRPGRGWSIPRVLVLLGFPLLCFYVFSTGRALLGIRYILPILPFAAVLMARAASFLPRSMLLLAVLAALESLWIHPHELMYFNSLAGGPVGGPRISIVGDDWGQDVRALGRYYQRHRAKIEEAGGLYYDPYTTADPAAFHLEGVEPVRPGVRGIVAVNAINYYRERKTYEWLDAYEPFERLGWSIALYDTRVPPPGGSPEFE